MYQVLDFKIEPQSKVVIDDQLKSQYQGISALVIWTPEYEDIRNIDVELKIDASEVLPAGFPAELHSINNFRNNEDCTLKLDFPKNSRIEGIITNGNDKAVDISLIFTVKLK